jgi:hypothetical protein
MNQMTFPGIRRPQGLGLGGRYLEQSKCLEEFKNIAQLSAEPTQQPGAALIHDFTDLEQTAIKGRGNGSTKSSHSWSRKSGRADRTT